MSHTPLGVYAAATAKHPSRRSPDERNPPNRQYMASRPTRSSVLPGAISSSTLRNDPRTTGPHLFIEPLPGLNSIDFVNRVYRKSGNVEILPGAGRTLGRSKQSRAALHGPRQ